MPAKLPTYSPDEIARRGDEIYEQQIRPQFESSHHGQIAAIDVHSGNYAIGATPVEAAQSLREQVAEAEVWFVRMGYRAVHHLGGLGVGADD